MLTITDYTKVYPGGKTAVDRLTLHVAPGEICGFIGHNGAGKTTTLRAVAGVMSFTRGTITIGGRDIQREPVAAMDIEDDMNVRCKIQAIKNKIPLFIPRVCCQKKSFIL